MITLTSDNPTLIMGLTQMTIKTLKNENGATIYHVIDCGVIQEFWTLKSAQNYVDYVLGLDV